MKTKALVSAVGGYIPPATIDNATLLATLKADFDLPGPELLERICGISKRHVAAPDQQASDLAVAAAEPLFAGVGSNGAAKKDIDFLIFASACGDLIEPATANIVQQKLGLTCPAMDVKNACNSFVSAVQVASAFIESGVYKKILIVNGEKPSDSVRRIFSSKQQFSESLSAFSLGDAGAAMIVEAGTDQNRGLMFQKFWTMGEHWDLCTILGGGSMYPHDDEAYYFKGQTSVLRKIVQERGPSMWKECLPVLGWKAKDVDWLFTHQVSEGNTRMVATGIGVPQDRCVSLFDKHGNMAAASIPVCMHSVAHRFKPGDKILMVGLAAGISVSVQALVW